MRIGLLSSILPKEIRKKINELIRLSWTREPVAGYGMSISRRANGTVFSCTLQGGGGGNGGGGGGDDYDGPFTVALKNDRLSVSWPARNGTFFSGAGYAYVNGNGIACPEGSYITPREGFLYLRVSKVENVAQYDIDYIVSSSTDIYPMPVSGDLGSYTCYYPLAFISESESGWKIDQIVRWTIPQLWAFGTC